MGRCDAILQQGIFDTILKNSAQTTAEGLTTWLKDTSYGDVQNKVNAGLSIALPIEGIPLDFGANFNSEQHQQWKNGLDSGSSRSFTQAEAETIVQRSVDQGIVDAWKSCMLHPSFGMQHNVQSTPGSGDFTWAVSYAPDSKGDPTPTVVDFHIQGATAINAPAPGTEILPGGFVIQCSRTPIPGQKDSYGPATLSLNVHDGESVTDTVPSVSPKVPQAPDVVVQIFGPLTSGGPTAHPEANASVPAGWKLIGGGGSVSYSGAGNMLTASFPSSPTTWTVRAKDHVVSSPGVAQAWAIGLQDNNDEWEVLFVAGPPSVGSHPTANATLPQGKGYALTCGGAAVQYGGAGQLLTSSYPLDDQTWTASSKDHEVLDAESVLQVIVIGIRPRNGAPAPRTVITASQPTAPIAHPSGIVAASPGSQLTGGGARDDYHGAGNLLVSSNPAGSNWSAGGKDHDVSDPASLTIYAVGLQPQLVPQMMKIRTPTARQFGSIILHPPGPIIFPPFFHDFTVPSEFIQRIDFRTGRFSTLESKKDAPIFAGENLASEFLADIRKYWLGRHGGPSNEFDAGKRGT